MKKKPLLPLYPTLKELYLNTIEREDRIKESLATDKSLSDMSQDSIVCFRDLYEDLYNLLPTYDIELKSYIRDGSVYLRLEKAKLFIELKFCKSVNFHRRYFLLKGNQDFLVSDLIREVENTFC